MVLRAERLLLAPAHVGVSIGDYLELVRDLPCPLGVGLVLRAVRGLRRCCWLKGWRCCSLVLRAERLLWAPAVQMWTGVVWGCVGAAG